MGSEADFVDIPLPEFGQLVEASRNRKEEWLWDRVVPKGDTTLLAAFQKRGKTTILTGLVKAMLRSGFYCGRTVAPMKKVLYLAPEEGDTLVMRLARLGFGTGSMLSVIPRGDKTWNDLIRHYRMREWVKVVRGWKKKGFDVVILDGLHTMLHMFEPTGKEDNEGVSQFYSNFVLPFDSNFTVIASLHTKKRGGDPKVRIPPEEMIRGASAWMAHPGQVIIMERGAKDETERHFHAFGRHDATAVEGFVVRYDRDSHDYVEVGGDKEIDLEARIEQRARSIVENLVIQAVRNGAQTKLEIMAKAQQRESEVKAALASAVATGMLKPGPARGRVKTWILGDNLQIGPDLVDSPEEVDE